MGLYLGDKPVVLHLGDKRYKVNILAAPMKYVDVPVLAVKNGIIGGVSSALQSYEWRLLAPYISDMLSTEEDNLITDSNDKLMSVDE